MDTVSDVMHGYHLLRMSLFALLAATALAVAVGCSTTPDDDSDLPWNVRQPWEGAPTIPGMDR